jgi:hypothetical protein
MLRPGQRRLTQLKRPADCIRAGEMDDELVHGGRGRGRGRGQRGRDQDRGRGGYRGPTIDKLAQVGFLRFLLPPVRDAGLAAAGTAEPADPLGEAFAEVGAAVAAAKSALDSIPEAEFEGFMRRLDTYGGLKRTLRTEYGMQVVTNAAAKMAELIVQMQLMPLAPPAAAEGRARLRVFCDAELPGAFLSAINHYVCTERAGMELDWVASSYYPPAAAARGDSTILGDHYGVYAANRGRWLMGPRPNAMPEGAPDTDGDLTDAATVAALAAAVHARFPAAGRRGSGADLYTSDAGIDVSADYNRQEELTARLNFGQVLAGLLSLAPGGHLATKQYTFISPFSRSVLALIAACFDEAFVTKPLTSRPANSEVYIVGKGFRGITRSLAAGLLTRLASLGQDAGGAALAFALWPPLFGSDVRGPLDEVLLRAARQIHGRQQVAFLKEAAAAYAEFGRRPGDLSHALAREARHAQEAWLALNPVRRIDESCLLAVAPPDAGARR